MPRYRVSYVEHVYDTLDIDADTAQEAYEEAMCQLNGQAELNDTDNATILGVDLASDVIG